MLHFLGLHDCRHLAALRTPTNVRSATSMSQAARQVAAGRVHTGAEHVPNAIVVGVSAWTGFRTVCSSIGNASDA